MNTLALALLIGAPAEPPPAWSPPEPPAAWTAAKPGPPAGYHEERDAAGAVLWVRDGWTLAKPTATPGVVAPSPFAPGGSTRATDAPHAGTSLHPIRELGSSVAPPGTVGTGMNATGAIRGGNTDPCPPSG